MEPQTAKKYKYWQWRTLIVLMIGYVMYYFVRKNFSAALPAMEAELGVSKVQLGIFLTLNGVIYGFSRFLNGYVADRFSRKGLMSLGLLLSAFVNFGICFSPQIVGLFTGGEPAFDFVDGSPVASLSLVYLIGILWVLNGYIHGMGFPPCATLMARWFRPSELATKQSIWNASHSIGAGIVVALCGFLISRYGTSAWNLCFAVPGAIALFGAAFVFFGLKDTPSSLGLPEVEELEAEEQVKAGAAAGEVKMVPGEELTGNKFKVFMRKMVFGNPIIWILALANFCVYVIRFTILDWGTSFLTQYKGFEIDLASSIVATSEIVGGVIGTLVAGWITDKFMKSRAHRTCFIFAVGATLCLFGFWKTPAQAPWILSAFFICMSAFFIYGPQALLGVCASQQATNKACATANGILGIFGYASTTISGVGFGYLAQHYGWNSVFIVAIGFGILASIIIATIWNRPADGYGRARKVIEEMQQEK